MKKGELPRCKGRHKETLLEFLRTQKETVHALQESGMISFREASEILRSDSASSVAGQESEQECERSGSARAEQAALTRYEVAVGEAFKEFQDGM